MSAQILGFTDPKVAKLRTRKAKLEREMEMLQRPAKPSNSVEVNPAAQRLPHARLQSAVLDVMIRIMDARKDPDNGPLVERWGRELQLASMHLELFELQQDAETAKFKPRIQELEDEITRLEAEA